MLRNGDRTLKASPGLPRRAGLFFANWNMDRLSPLVTGMRRLAQAESIVTIVVMDSGLARFAPAPE